MKFKGIRVTSMVLVFILLIVSCSNGKEEVVEEASEPMTSEVKDDSEETSPAGALDEEENLETVEENETEDEAVSNDSYSENYDNEEILLDYLSYMLPHMLPHQGTDNMNLESLETGAASLNISKEELYIYAMTTLFITTVSIVGGEEKTAADETRVVNGLRAFLNGEGDIDPWVKNYAFNVIYEGYNERGDLDRWKELSEKEKEKYINDALNKKENTEEDQ